MDDEISKIIAMLSSRSVLERKSAIKELKKHLSRRNACIARLCLQYVSEHDPVFTVRNIARQAAYRLDSPEARGCWEKSYLFHKE